MELKDFIPNFRKILSESDPSSRPMASKSHKIYFKIQQTATRMKDFISDFRKILSESDPSMLGFQESAMKLEDSISDFRKILMFATKTTSDFRNPDRKRARRGRIAGICTFTAPVAARFSGIRRLSCRII